MTSLQPPPMLLLGLGRVVFWIGMILLSTGFCFAIWYRVTKLCEWVAATFGRKSPDVVPPSTLDEFLNFHQPSLTTPAAKGWEGHRRQRGVL